MAIVLSLFAGFSSYIPAVNAVCNPVTGLGCQSYYAAYLSVYSSPTKGGNISGYPSGTTFRHPWCTYGRNVAFSIYETPNSGFVFENWSNGQNATSITVNVPCGGSGSVTANFAYFGGVLTQYYEASNNNKPSSTNPDSLPNTGTSDTPPCSFGNAPTASGSNWYLYICTGQLDGVNTVEMAFQQNGGNGWSGIVGISLQLLQNATVQGNWVGTISMNYQNSTGSILHMGDEWLQNFTASLSIQLNNLQNNIGDVELNYLYSGSDTLYQIGVTYQWIWYGLQTMISAITQNTGYGSYVVQTVGAMTGQYILNDACQAAIIFAAVAVPIGLVEVALYVVGITTTLSLSTLAAFPISAAGLAIACTT